MGTIQALLKRIAQTLPNTTQGNLAYRSMYRLIGNTLPIYLNDDKKQLLEKAYIFNAQVFAVINRIAVRAASLPRILYRVNNQKVADQLFYMKWQDKVQYKSYLKKALSEIPEHEILDILNKPNDLTTGADFFEGLMVYLCSTGDAFIYGFVPGKTSPTPGKQIELVLLPSQYVEIVAGTAFNPVAGYRLAGNWEKELELQKERVTHIKHFNPIQNPNGSGLYGLSPLTPGRRSITESNAGFDTSISYYQNNGIRGIFTKKDNANMTYDQAQDLQRTYEKKYTNENAGRVLVTSASVDWKNVGLSPVDLGILESRKFTMRDICNLFAFPSQLMNDTDNNNYSNMKEASRVMVTNAVLPRYDKIMYGLTNGFVASHNTDKDKFILNYDTNLIPELQADLEMLVNQLGAAWWIKPNEKRAAMGYEEDTNPAMNQYYIPANLVSLSDSQVDEEAEEEIEKRLKEVLKFGEL